MKLKPHGAIEVTFEDRGDRLENDLIWIREPRTSDPANEEGIVLTGEEMMALVEWWQQKTIERLKSR